MIANWIKPNATNITTHITTKDIKAGALGDASVGAIVLSFIMLYLPTLPSQAQSCYMEDSQGNVIPLDGLCSGNNNPPSSTPSTAGNTSQNNAIPLQIGNVAFGTMGLTGEVTNISGESISLSSLSYQILYERGHTTEVVISSSASVSSGRPLNPGAKTQFSDYFDSMQQQTLDGYFLNSLIMTVMYEGQSIPVSLRHDASLDVEE